MADDGVFIKLQGVDEAIAQLRALPDKLRKRAILNALRAGGRVFRDEARRLTPVLQVPVRRKGGGVIRKPGTVRKAINVRTSKIARRGGDLGVFVNVRPAKGAAKGANRPDDPFYWRWLEFGRSARSSQAERVRVKSNKKAGIKAVRHRRRLAAVGGIAPFRFLQQAAQKGAQALNVIVSTLGPQVQKIVDRQAAE
ncbi:MAG: HK97 gp10 family phage protein [Burkholderiaceae bacterium]|nr:HK97 gp10 family phage protein [Burkholderiaceae bacterium]